jgi:tetratricopeptide (TPR) repeat protein
VLVSAAVLLLPLGHLTTLQVETWRDENHLWGHATRTQPNAVYAWIKLGETRRDRRDVEAAVRAYARAVEVAPELRMAHAGFLSALALRDERNEGIAPSAALSLATRYLVLIDDARRLRDLASEMVDQGYQDAAAYVLGRSLDLDPVSNERLERAILVQLRGGNAFMARFYLSRLTSRPMLPEVTAFWEAERERLGLVTDEEREARERVERPEPTPLVLPGTP